MGHNIFALNFNHLLIIKDDVRDTRLLHPINFFNKECFLQMLSFINRITTWNPDRHIESLRNWGNILIAVIRQS